MSATVSISQQYLLASKARAKLMRCAATDSNKDYNLRVLVGHANLLDRVMESVDSYNTRITKSSMCQGHSVRSRSDSGHNDGRTQVDYFSSDDDDDDYSSSSSDSEYDDDDDSSASDSDCREDEYDFSQPPKYIHSSSATRPQQPAVSVVTVTIDQCLDDKDYDDYNSDTDSDSEGSPISSNMEQDLSMMPLTLQAKVAHEHPRHYHILHTSLDNHELGEVTPIQV
ncbi:hypothetical protein HG535_0B04930 [Zygotorulaspora mrakii]|uniref:Uncharacterized protein n=1 Tax=Zygotorulaspora mrakii TaxID=42260 RepID=A0A7H9AYR4_ZYGMR|nr:uncharacterized protein HG535_0B04930 [Zygotorulaspora mrakii]QLG71451.1 hypothetical protein HG535_0B04930 [Zygotorulaspora mrakii]